MELKINNNRYEIVPFRAKEAIKLQTKLFSIIAPSLGQIFNGITDLKNVDMDSQIEGSGIADAVKSIFQQIDENTFEDLQNRILKDTYLITKNKDNKTIKLPLTDEVGFEKAFTTNTMEVYQVMYAVLEVNYPDFFQKLKSNIGNVSRIFG